MSFIKFWQEFFRITTDLRGNYIIYLATIAPIVTVLTFFCGIYFGIKFKKKSEKDRNKLVLITSIVCWGFEIIYILVPLIKGDFIEVRDGRIPLFLCDIQFFALIAICFGKGKVKEAGMGFVICLGLLAFVMGVWINAGNLFDNNPLWSGTVIWRIAVHALPGFIGLFIVCSGMYKLELKKVWYANAIMVPFELAALIVCLCLPTANYMFFNNPDGTPFKIFYDLVKGNMGAYRFFVILLMNLYVVLFYSGWELISYLIKKHKNKKLAVKYE